MPGLPSGTYTVTPSKNGFTFSPSTQSVTVTTTNATAVNFTAQPVVIAGTITPSAIGSGATLTLSRRSGRHSDCEWAGVYTFNGIADGTYTVTPSKTGFVFAPTSQPVTITGGLSATGVDFTGTPVPTWTSQRRGVRRRHGSRGRARRNVEPPRTTADAGDGGVLVHWPSKRQLHRHTDEGGLYDDACESRSGQ